MSHDLWSLIYNLIVSFDHNVHSHYLQTRALTLKHSALQTRLINTRLQLFIWDVLELALFTSSCRKVIFLFILHCEVECMCCWAHCCRKPCHKSVPVIDADDTCSPARFLSLLHSCIPLHNRRLSKKTIINFSWQNPSLLTTNIRLATLFA